MSAQSPCHVLHPFSWAVLTVPIFLSHTHCTKTCTHSLTLYQHMHSLPHSHTVRTRAPSLPHKHHTNMCTLPHSRKHRTNMCTLPHSHKHCTNSRTFTPKGFPSLSHTHTHHTNVCALSLTHTHTHCPTPPPPPPVPSHSSVTAMASGGGILPAWGSQADGGGEDGEALYVKLGDGQQRMVHPVQEREDAHAQGWTLFNVPAHRTTGQ